MIKCAESIPVHLKWSLGGYIKRLGSVTSVFQQSWQRPRLLTQLAALNAPIRCAETTKHQQ